MTIFRIQYEKLYKGQEYYWGLEPASFLDDLLSVVNKKESELSVLDIGCGEGKDAVYMAQKGCKVTAFDLTETGVKKTKLFLNCLRIGIKKIKCGRRGICLSILKIGKFTILMK